MVPRTQKLGYQIPTASQLPTALQGRPQLFHNLPLRPGQRPIQSASSGILVTSAVKPFRNCGYIDASLAPQTHTHTRLCKFAQEHRNLHLSYR